MAEIQILTEYHVRLTREELEALKWSLQVAINQGATPTHDLIKLRDALSGALSR